MTDDPTKDSLELSEQDMFTALSGGITLDEFISWESSFRDSINVRRVYIDICDDLIAGILLSQIVYWFLPTEEGNSRLSVEREGRYWLAKSREDWWKECRISPKQFDRVSTILENKKFIETRVFKFNGLAVKHIGLNMQMVFLRVKALLPKGQKQLNSPKGNPAIPQKVRPYKEAEITTENTSEITHKNFDEGFALVPVESNGKPKKHTRVLQKTLPEWLPDEEWNGWLEMRKKMRKPATDIAQEEALSKLNKLRLEGENIREVIRYAISRNWLSFWGTKSNGNGFHNGPQSRTNGSGATGHLLDHLPDAAELERRRRADDRRLEERRNARGM